MLFRFLIISSLLVGLIGTVRADERSLKRLVTKGTGTQKFIFGAAGFRNGWDGEMTVECRNKRCSISTAFVVYHQGAFAKGTIAGRSEDKTRYIQMEFSESGTVMQGTMTNAETGQKYRISGIAVHDCREFYACARQANDKIVELMRQ